ncbi:trimethylamine methyltransferase family protein [Amaricoccus sp.]|uniref:trimethylamine methyltransferase family protein n=1 Tax=Amaricoccus sp. TaxID=1872485 RepID=UPI001B613DC7|nr:trimethylamine methyltransferase family protein [Amaricoccus sp.]MBP7240542.1 trimethylamine methyltransferase family protein [Amaricoccus sp.]
MNDVSEAVAGGRRQRGGGGAARRAERTAHRIEAAHFIRRRIPNFEILDEEGLALIEANADLVLEEIGVRFSDNPEALERWKAAGADVRGDRVHLPKGLARSLCRTAPSSFVQAARNPERNVEIGGRNLVLAPVYGPPFVRDMENGRRYATIADFRDLVKLGYMSKWVHHSGGTLCEPTDVAVNKRHLDMLLAHMTLSDKPFMGSVTAPERAADSVEMCRILFGADRVGPECFMTSLINVNSPLVFDATMMGALEVYARAGQATIVSPFIVGGAMAPVSVAGTLTQVLAEAMVGVAYSQLINPGCPVIFGAFVTSIDMNSGAPTFGTPEASKILWGAGQLARRLNLPFRSGGGLCGSKLPDAQAAYESANTLQAALLGGVNFMLHACGWLEGGLVTSLEKFVMDADQLGVLHSLAEGVDLSGNGQALDAIREVGPGGHYLGCAHTQANFKTAFWRTEVLDYRPFETWSEAGGPDSVTLANRRMRRLLSEYEAPALDSGAAEALADFVARRKASEPDAFA